MNNFKNNINLKIEPKIEDLINIGSCIKIKNSLKTFQIIGINQKKTICWVREWPLCHEGYQTFELSIHKIILSTLCPSIQKASNN